MHSVLTGEILVFNGCDTTVKNSRFKDMTGWDIAISRGNIETFDVLCHLAQLNRRSSRMYPNLNSEFQLQKLRRNECLKNREALEYGNRPVEIAASQLNTR